MNDWNFNIDDAPQSYMEDTVVIIKDKETTKQVLNKVRVITASKCDKVIVSYWIPKEDRWCMYSKNESPIAWQHYPEHPNAA